MHMTPKNIMSKPVFGLAGIFGIVGLIIFVPGGLLILAAFWLGCLGDKMSEQPYDMEADTTIEEYERYMDEDTEV